MPTSKAERLMDLVIALVNTRYYRTASWIRDHVAGYGGAADGETRGDADEAFARMFERDKQELRDLGIPIETQPGGDGYRIEPSAFALPPLSLTAAESAALAVAARLWDTTVLGDIGGAALRKVLDAAESVDADGSDAPDAEPSWTATVQARLRTPEPSFADLFGAVRARRAVRFDYRGVTDLGVVSRSVDPWGLVNFRGAWYLVGFDTDRQAKRTFRLSRIAGDVAAVGRAGAVKIPPDIDLKQAVATAGDEAASSAALLRIRVGRAVGLRRMADSSEPTSTGEYDDVRVPMTSLTDLARRVAAHGADVIVVDPIELRTAVETIFRGVVAPR
ncbi:MAG: WYL domain-containing protein [Nakamurella sp.]